MKGLKTYRTVRNKKQRGQGCLLTLTRIYLVETLARVKIYAKCKNSPRYCPVTRMDKACGYTKLPLVDLEVNLMTVVMAATFLPSHVLLALVVRKYLLLLTKRPREELSEC